MPLRNAVAKLVGLKHTPELHFRRNVILQEQSQLEEVWQARSSSRPPFGHLLTSPPQALELERRLEGEDEQDSDYESEEEEPPPAEPPRSVPL